MMTTSSSWQQTVVAGLAMLALAGLDLAGSFAAKEAAVRRSPLFAACGAVLLLALFAVSTMSLRYAELSLVRLGRRS